jgi:putative addiction module component (TIGR02574 family)
MPVPVIASHSNSRQVDVMRPNDIDIASLSVEQRLQLIESLTASLDETERPVSEAVRAELRHRIATVPVDRDQLHDAREAITRLSPRTD